MRVLQCGSVDYPGGHIYSIDFHPSGKFLATCGNNDGNGLVTIWDTAFLEHKEDDSDDEENNPQSTANEDSLPMSSASVATNKAKNIHKRYMIGEARFYTSNNNQNCVRWSRRGHWLASGGDNSIIYFFKPKFDATTNKVSLNDVVNLAAHKMEVVHVDFSKNGKYLASCSLDNTVIIWSVEDQPRRIKVLDLNCEGHTNFVTGLAWDPADRYLATQSMDKSVKIWLCSNWECERTIQGYFSSASRASLFSRLDWSTDGAFLIATCAENNGFQTAKLLIRKEFQDETDFVGFSGPVTCVRSNNRCVLYNDPIRGEVTANLIAIGSTDQSVSVWLLPFVNRPLCVIQNIFPDGVLDLSWHNTTLSIIGPNGCVRCIVFDDAEIGRFLSGREMCDHFDNLYSRIPTEYRTYQRDLNEDGGSEWIEKVLKDVYQPSEQLIAQANDLHNYVLCHSTTPACPKCRDFNLRTRRELDNKQLGSFIAKLQNECNTKKSTEHLN